MKLRPFLPFLLLLFSFVALLLSMNSYQYFRLKSNLGGEILTVMGALERAELQTYLTGLEKNLKLIRDLGKDINLEKVSVTDLNKQYMPFLINQKDIEAIIIANSKGREYLLTRKDENFVTRSASLEKQGTQLRYQEWSAENKLLDSWKEEKDYSSLNRPWYIGAVDRNILSWTEVYTFFYSKKTGVTASVAEDVNSKSSERNVFAIDISLDDIQRILAKIQDKGSSLLFLVNDEGQFIASGNQGLTNQGGSLGVDNVDKIAAESSSMWINSGKPLNKLMHFNVEDMKLAVIFDKVAQQNKHIWLGLVVPEKVIEETLNQSLLRFDFIELGIAAIGFLVTFFLLWKLNYLKRASGKEALRVDHKVIQYVKKGEGPDIEFKSTVRTNLKNGKHGKEIEFAWLKAVVAFLNSKGGVLLLGVDDGGGVAGLEKDAFENEDKCLLHIKNLINHHIGAEFSAYIVTTAAEISGKNVVMIECQSSQSPVFLKIGKNEEFYIRSGPSSTKLTPSQMVSYLDKKRN